MSIVTLNNGNNWSSVAFNRVEKVIAWAVETIIVFQRSTLVYSIRGSTLVYSIRGSILVYSTRGTTETLTKKKVQ